ncbi:hypothetical protein MPDQ_004151 [Monascus purpureus]|uniref:thioredoxin-dependent peroxiredoxin n=1 Tax=Monascus purpureus TaxID=5098 RepID=A0A507QLU6_MONPU|nr:hypothetical protein MPDQ_004151 [Monascus purpureus]BDD61925.1 hypothetical protein MAP00_006939 [Monascus purpureus]
MVELRKRKAPAPLPVPEKKSKNPRRPRNATKEEPANGTDASHTGSPSGNVRPTVGQTIDLDGFGGEIETNDGTKTTLKALVDASKSGVVLFTYPRASTPGCTRQACLFRDNYDALISDGLLIYGLSTDSPKANTAFKSKQNLPYPLLCDTNATLIKALGLKKVPRGTVRAVFVINKEGKVLLLQPGGPERTVEAAKQLVSAESGKNENGNANNNESEEQGEGEGNRTATGEGKE